MNAPEPFVPCVTFLKTCTACNPLLQLSTMMIKQLWTGLNLAVWKVSDTTTFMKMWLENLNNMEKSTSNIAVVKPTQVTHSPKNTNLHKSAERLVIPLCIQHLLLESSACVSCSLSVMLSSPPLTSSVFTHTSLLHVRGASSWISCSRSRQPKSFEWTLLPWKVFQSQTESKLFQNNSSKCRLFFVDTMRDDANSALS